MKKTNSKSIGYTAGAFDLFHIGHLNLLKNSKKNCDYLIVGVTTDELVLETKGKKPFIPFAERRAILESIKYVDEVVIQDDLDKVKAQEKYNYDVLFSGSDWETSPRWRGYSEKLAKKGVSIKYFPYTHSISSSKIQDIISPIFKVVE